MCYNPNVELNGEAIRAELEKSMIINLCDTEQHMQIELVTWSNILTASSKRVSKRVMISPKCVMGGAIEYWLQELESDIAAIRRKLDRRGGA